MHTYIYIIQFYYHTPIFRTIHIHKYAERERAKTKEAKTKRQNNEYLNINAFPNS